MLLRIARYSIYDKYYREIPMLIKVTRKVESLDGGTDKWNPMWLNIRAVITIMRHPDTGETWISTGPTYHIVKETPEEVVHLIDEVRKVWFGR
jgi:uncharacterized protein YlzI (FlbEa/FlbD family)